MDYLEPLESPQQQPTQTHTDTSYKAEFYHTLLDEWVQVPGTRRHQTAKQASDNLECYLSDYRGMTYYDYRIVKEDIEVHTTQTVLSQVRGLQNE